MKEEFCDAQSINFNSEKHWNNAYLKTPVNSLGWYEESPNPSLKLIESCRLPKDALIFNAGAGTTTLIAHLLDKNYTNFIINDISSAALTQLESSLPKHNNAQIKYIVDDLTNPTELQNLKNIDLWHDRAVLHFFTKAAEQKNYFDLLKHTVKKGGFVILAEFNLQGAKKCSGLNTFNYNEEMLQDCLGADFDLINSFDYIYKQPSGNTRAYIYTLFKRTA